LKTAGAGVKNTVRGKEDFTEIMTPFEWEPFRQEDKYRNHTCREVETSFWAESFFQLQDLSMCGDDDVMCDDDRSRKVIQKRVLMGNSRIFFSLSLWEKGWENMGFNKTTIQELKKIWTC
jgi:hypothetical protein